MLKQLNINNLILVEKLSIHFSRGFNVITGETGAGKSAIMSALKLISGARTDSGMIRRGHEKATVEAQFDVENIPALKLLLEEAGIDHDELDDLIIRREIAANGKSRAYVNNQMAQLSLLRKIGEHLIDIVGQHANQRLFQVEEHRHILDLYGDIQSDLLNFQRCWSEESKVKKALDDLVSSEARRLREIEVCRAELEELDEAQLKEGEEEELFSEYSRLNSAEEITEKAESIHNALYGTENSIIHKLSRELQNFEGLIKIDTSLSDSYECYKSALIELKEVSYSLRDYLGGIESDPIRTQTVDDRLQLINKLKRKYGLTIANVLEYRQARLQRLDELENADVEIEELENQLAALQNKSNQLANIVTDHRKIKALDFAEALEQELRDLNMPKVKFHVSITPQKRTVEGDERIEYFISPNIGEHSIPVKDCASGGEVSRLLLALQKILTDKTRVPTIIFDEVDANIGGETALIVGKKLTQIGTMHQVLCITHFPQVAKQAQYHLQIEKIELEGRTLSTVSVLNEQSRQTELNRMAGASDVIQKVTA